MMQQQLATLGEFGLIRQIQQCAGSAEHLLLGIGDDCAIQRQDAEQELLTSTDMLIEGVHFNLDWTSLEDLGRKAVAVNVSDIAAMGGVPQSLYLGVACSKQLNPDALLQLSRGVLAEAERYGVVLAGGDTCASPGPLILSVTVQGVAPCGTAVRRSGARVGDVIYVSGTLGDSALALQQLLQGEAPDPLLAERHHRPQARVELGQRLREQQLVHAMLDVSDGLLGDLGHLLETAQAGADLELSRLPLSTAFRAALEKDPALLELALNGGEDYELLFTSPRHDLEGAAGLTPSVTRIGTITAPPGIRCRLSDGSLYQPQRGGFDHFART